MKLLNTGGANSNNSQLIDSFVVPNNKNVLKRYRYSYFRGIWVDQWWGIAEFAAIKYDQFYSFSMIFRIKCLKIKLNYITNNINFKFTLKLCSFPYSIASPSVITCRTCPWPVWMGFYRIEKRNHIPVWLVFVDLRLAKASPPNAYQQLNQYHWRRWCSK